LGRKGVARTALFVAAVRARENERADPLFRDELASILAGEEGRAWLKASEADPKSRYRRGRFPYLEVRTKFFDDWLPGSVSKSGSRQQYRPRYRRRYSVRAYRHAVCP
jgi:O-methyltransferase involved in polyketide biosynthesis